MPSLKRDSFFEEIYFALQNSQALLSLNILLSLKANFDEHVENIIKQHKRVLNESKNFVLEKKEEYKNSIEDNNLIINNQTTLIQSKKEELAKVEQTSSFDFSSGSFFFNILKSAGKYVWKNAKILFISNKISDLEESNRMLMDKNIVYVRLINTSVS